MDESDSKSSTHPLMSEEFLLEDGRYLLGTSRHGTACCVDLVPPETVKDRSWNDTNATAGKCVSCGRPGPIDGYGNYCYIPPCVGIGKTDLGLCLVCQNIGVKDQPCGNGCWISAKCVSLPWSPVMCNVCGTEYLDTPGNECLQCKNGKMQHTFLGQIIFSPTRQTFDFPDD
jgi:hypothetical protein